jgi:hypothetical protein
MRHGMGQLFDASMLSERLLPRVGRLKGSWSDPIKYRRDLEIRSVPSS